MKLLTTSVPSKYAKFSVSVTKSLGCNCFVLSSCSCQHPCSKACCFVMWLCHLGTSKGFLLVSWPGAGGSVVLLCWGMCTSWVRTAQLRLAVLSLLWLAELLLLPAEVHPSGTLVVQRNTVITSKLTCVCKSILQVPLQVRLLPVIERLSLPCVGSSCLDSFLLCSCSFSWVLYAGTLKTLFFKIIIKKKKQKPPHSWAVS